MYPFTNNEIEKTNPLWRTRYDAGYEQAIEDTKGIVKDVLTQLEYLKKNKGLHTFTETVISKCQIEYYQPQN